MMAQADDLSVFLGEALRLLVEKIEHRLRRSSEFPEPVRRIGSCGTNVPRSRSED